MADVEQRKGAVLVTGAGGFIGRHLATRLLESGHSVRALDLDLASVRGLEADGLELLEADIADPSVQRRGLCGVEAVYHLAAAHLGASIESTEFERVNVDALRTLVDNAIEAGANRFVHCSSVGVYGRITDAPADEDTPCRPRLAYEITKLAAEEVVLDAVRRRGLPAVILRPAWVYGPGCPRTHKLFSSIAHGRFVVAGSGRTSRHCVYIRDMVDALQRAGSGRNLVGEIFVIGDRRPVSIRELVDEVARLTGARPPPRVPMFAMATAAAAVEFGFRALRREPPLSRRTLEFFQGNTSFRVERARHRLGWEPRYDVTSGLAEAHRYWSRGDFWKVPLGAVGANGESPSTLAPGPLA
jgi:nucleoside-diphosphate-sugar epimerase